MRAGRLVLAAPVALLAAACACTAQARGPALVSVGGFSSQASPASALIGGEIDAGSSGAAASAGSAGPGVAAPSAEPPTPTLAAGSPLLADPAPAGRGSFWYQGAAGERCIYAPSSSPACFVVLAPAPALDIAATAARLEAELDLSLAPIDASPAAARAGLTGAPSWFWLDSPPAPRELSLSLDGETVAVSAQPGAVAWSFGDGGSLVAGAGVPFAPGPAPPGAVTHVFETRCLPGDRGSDPYVLAGCGPQGYLVGAAVTWTVGFDATGAVGESGALPARSTRSTLTYPVSEVRAFLSGGAG